MHDMQVKLLVRDLGLAGTQSIIQQIKAGTHSSHADTNTDFMRQQGHIDTVTRQVLHGGTMHTIVTG